MQKIAKKQLRPIQYAFCTGCEDKAIHVATHYYRVSNKIVMSVCRDFLKDRNIKESSAFVQKIIKEK